RGCGAIWPIAATTPRRAPSTSAAALEAQRLDVGGVTLRPAAEHRGAGDQHVGTGGHGLLRRLGIDAAIDLEIDDAAARVDHLAQGGDLGELALDEALPAEARVDAHHQHQVDVTQ